MIAYDLPGHDMIWCTQKPRMYKKLKNQCLILKVIIQHHDYIVTSTDLGLALNCQYDLTNRTIVNDFDLAIDGEIEPSLFAENQVDSPNVIMKITQR